jgi:hypothetical protein
MANKYVCIKYTSIGFNRETCPSLRTNTKIGALRGPPPPPPRPSDRGKIREQIKNITQRQAERVD